MWPVAARSGDAYVGPYFPIRELLIGRTHQFLVAFSDAAAELVERTQAASCRSRRQPMASAHPLAFRRIVTAENLWKRDEISCYAFPEARIAASLAAGIPALNVAYSAFQADGCRRADGCAASLARSRRPAVGNHEGAPIASLGMVAVADRLGTVFARDHDQSIRLDLCSARPGGASSSTCRDA